MLVLAGRRLLRLPRGGAGGGALVAGLVALVGLGEGRTLVHPAGRGRARSSWPPGWLTEAARLRPGRGADHRAGRSWSLAGSVFPWLALGATGTNVDQLVRVADITADPAEIDPDRVGADARVAHEILVAVSATVGLLLVLVAPARRVAWASPAPCSRCCPAWS